jgi:hypothetical protein
MENENNSIEETLTQDTEAEIEIDLDDNQDDETVDWKAIALKNQEAYKNQKTRAEIAEGKAKVAKPQANQTQPETTLTVKDGFALAKANVNDEDIDEVLEYANFKKISVADALKSSVVKSLLAEKEEFRTSQTVSITANARRASPKITDDTILDNARKGKLDDSDEGIERLFKARMGLK